MHEKANKGGFSILEMMVATVVLVLMVTLLASVNNHTMQLYRRTTSQGDAFQSARLAFDLMIRQLNQATLNVYWDYDNPVSPTRYLRKSDLAFVTGKASTLLPGPPDRCPGQALFFEAPLGRLNDPSSRQLNLMLNTCGFYIEYGDANFGAPAFMGAPVRNRYRLMQLQTSGEEMKVFTSLANNSSDNTWFTGRLGESRAIAENIVLLIVRPLAPGPGGTRVDLASGNYSLDTRLSQNANPQPPTSNQLPPLISVTLVAVSEESMNRKNPANGYEFSGSSLSLFSNPSDFDYENDIAAFQSTLKQEKLDYRLFNQQVALPNSKWSD